MNLLSIIKLELLQVVKNALNLSDQDAARVDIVLNVDKEKTFGDLSCNAAMMLAKQLGKNPRELAQEIEQAIILAGQSEGNPALFGAIKAVQIAGPGFLNITLNNEIWWAVALEFFQQKDMFYQLEFDEKTRQNFLIEFVSANPTGPLHLGHGRGGIIGDTLARVLNFLGHKAEKEFYINDAGNQLELLGKSLKIRCLQQCGQSVELPDQGYAGEYLVDLAKECIDQLGRDVVKNDDKFFADYAKEKMLDLQRKDLESYRIVFDRWYSEKTLHDSGTVAETIELLKEKELVYESDGALWFKSTQFGDDKDRVVKKSDGSWTYIAADIAYHKDKLDRGYNKLVNVLGQDHHGYVKRLKSTMEALGYDANRLDVILYQLVTIKENDVVVRMSKRAGKFTELSDVIEAVGADVARFFYLNRKAEAHLEFDLAVALKKTDENPVFYIQYAYVRINSLLEKARESGLLDDYINVIFTGGWDSDELVGIVKSMSEHEFTLLKKIVQLQDILESIASSYQTHLLSYYTWELANAFHNYYTNHKIIDVNNLGQTKERLFVVVLVKDALEICLDLLGLSKPEKM
jgi:arginyl-tRNA synthetase